MSTQPTITIEQIKARAGAASFSRGRGHHQNGALFDCTQRGDELFALCQGSEITPYRVWARLGADGIDDASCTCAYDYGGDCKHIVALLLAYLHDPDTFVQQDALRDTLMERSKEDLIGLIEQMLRRDPDLMSIIERPTPNTIATRGGVIDTAFIQRELHTALERYSDWDDAFAEQKIDELDDLALSFIQNNDWINAAVILCAILEECVQHDYPTYDEGEYAQAVDAVIDHLGQCLEHPDVQADTELRRRSLDALLGAFLRDVEWGGVGFGSDAPEILLQFTEPDDVPHLRAQILAERNDTDASFGGKWKRSAYEELLTQLDALDATDPEETLLRLAEQGLYLLRIRKLLELGRIEEAVHVICSESAHNYEFIQALEMLRQHGEEETALAVAEETAQRRGYQNEIATWLIARYEQRSNQEKVFEWRLKQMQEEPHPNHYANLKGVAQRLDKWEAVRPAVLEELARNQKFETLTLAYLIDEEWDLAWDTMPKAPNRYPFSTFGQSLELTVAEASRHARPDRALPVYIKQARAQINERSRSHYARAAQLLTVVRELHQQMGDEEGWEPFIQELRSEYKRLPALQDELNQAGL